MSCIASNITPCSGRQEYEYCSKHYQQARRHGGAVVSSRDKRPAIIEGEFAKIPLGIEAKDGYVIVDKQFAYLAEDNWRKTHYGYAIRSKDKILMHRLIKDVSKKDVVDHISGDKLDNRLQNIRVCTQSDNAKNQKLRVNNRTGYKGVYKQANGFRARIKHNYLSIELGVYETAYQAARAYNKGAKKYHGEFARLNDVLV